MTDWNTNMDEAPKDHGNCYCPKCMADFHHWLAQRPSPPEPQP